jgi:hypothetical protein
MSNDACDDDQLGELVPDPQVQKELNITRQTTHNWDTIPGAAPEDWPPPVYIGKHKHRFRGLLNRMKNNLLQKAIAERAKRHRRSEAA